MPLVLSQCTWFLSITFFYSSKKEKNLVGKLRYTWTPKYQNLIYSVSVYKWGHFHLTTDLYPWSYDSFLLRSTSSLCLHYLMSLKIHTTEIQNVIHRLDLRRMYYSGHCFLESWLFPFLGKYSLRLFNLLLSGEFLFICLSLTVWSWCLRFFVTVMFHVSYWLCSCYMF